ncbi:uncharacterized protein LOC121812959 [Haplochromis burtoni]|uniref:uncharacterized protein LOC121812959 n=1 Tax=Haplochromis burtoni TaxID=8153 RepID=UPI001C2D6171|nr:uncharacterized protein LOC121812959 [Haplochromis burtoni]
MDPAALSGESDLARIRRLMDWVTHTTNARAQVVGLKAIEAILEENPYLCQLKGVSGLICNLRKARGVVRARESTDFVQQQRITAAPEQSRQLLLPEVLPGPPEVFARPAGGVARPAGGFARPAGGVARPAGGVAREEATIAPLARHPTAGYWNFRTAGRAEGSQQKRKPTNQFRTPAATVAVPKGSTHRPHYSRGLDKEDAFVRRRL